MEAKIIYRTNGDYDREEVELVIDGRTIDSLSTAEDTPEDNNISRMGVVSFIEELLMAVNPKIKIIRITQGWGEE